MGKLDFRLGCHLTSYWKEDYLPARVRPLPVKFIKALDTDAQETTPRNIAISDLTWVAFFFLLRSGEHYKVGNDTTHHLFIIKDVQLFIEHQSYNAATDTNDILDQSDFISLLFKKQKNRVKS